MELFLLYINEYFIIQTMLTLSYLQYIQIVSFWKTELCYLYSYLFKNFSLGVSLLTFIHLFLSFALSLSVTPHQVHLTESAFLYVLYSHCTVAQIFSVPLEIYSRLESNFCRVSKVDQSEQYSISSHRRVTLKSSYRAYSSYDISRTLTNRSRR